VVGEQMGGGHPGNAPADHGDAARGLPWLFKRHLFGVLSGYRMLTRRRGDRITRRQAMACGRGGGRLPVAG
jgi:hypothetical protein